LRERKKSAKQQILQKKWIIKQIIAIINAEEFAIFIKDIHL
jgi:hypothetical protein